MEEHLTVATQRTDKHQFVPVAKDSALAMYQSSRFPHDNFTVQNLRRSLACLASEDAEVCCEWLDSSKVKAVA